METNLKNAISAMRMKIAEMEKEQRNNKNQRKTVRIVGERTKDPGTAYWDSVNLKHDLRIHYAAYGLLRGRNFDVTENKAEYEEYQGKRWHPLCDWLHDIDEVLNEFGYQLKNYVEKEDYWKRKYKSYDMERYEEIVCVSE